MERTLVASYWSQIVSALKVDAATKSVLDPVLLSYVACCGRWCCVVAVVLSAVAVSIYMYCYILCCCVCWYSTGNAVLLMLMVPIMWMLLLWALLLHYVLPRTVNCWAVVSFFTSTLLAMYEYCWGFWSPVAVKVYSSGKQNPNLLENASSKHVTCWKIWITGPLKGQCHEIFELYFFH